MTFARIHFSVPDGSHVVAGAVQAVFEMIGRGHGVDKRPIMDDCPDVLLGGIDEQRLASKLGLASPEGKSDVIRIEKH